MECALPERQLDRPVRADQGDPARSVALRLLIGVEQDGAYANLLLQQLLRQARLDPRDAALATELAYGTVRLQSTLDLVIGRCVDRPIDKLDPIPRAVLRLGSYQLLRTRVPAHAAVATSVSLCRNTGAARAAGLVNAVLRRVSERSGQEWLDLLSDDSTDVEWLSIAYAHPRWIVSAFIDAIAAVEPPNADPATIIGRVQQELEADNDPAAVTLVTWPGMSTPAELLEASPEAEPGWWSPYAVRLTGGDPAGFSAVAEGRVGVQDEGSQLCAIALTDAEVLPVGPSSAASGADGAHGERPAGERWLDMCAGPGGKAALLGAIAAQRGASLLANELHPHRAELVVRSAGRFPSVQVVTGDARDLVAEHAGTFDRVLLDAPCTGLGALRRRPEARNRRTTSDLADLVRLQSELLGIALELVRPGGVVAYVTCSPHLEETVGVIEAVLAERSDVNALDTRPLFGELPELGAGPYVQLWPAMHGTDAMFCALLRRALPAGS